jgi:hypothetical protein
MIIIDRANNAYFTVYTEVGIATTKAEKSKLASVLGKRISLLDKYYDIDPTANEAAAHELVHALHYPRRCALGYVRDKFGLGDLVGAFCRPLDGPTFAEIYEMALAGMMKLTGYNVMGMDIRKNMTSQGDIDIASAAAAHLTANQVHQINRRIIGDGYCQTYFNILGFKTLNSRD